jgi:hypothetical protein
MAWCWSGENRSNRNLSFLFFAKTCRSVAFRLPSSVVGFLPYTSILLIDPPHETAWFEGSGFIWPDSEEKQAARLRELRLGVERHMLMPRVADTFGFMSSRLMMREWNWINLA